MALRIKLKVKAKSSNKLVETAALVKTGFETEKPQLLIPLRLAKELELWPPPPEAELVELGTAAGPVRNYVIYNALEVSATTGDRATEPVACDAVISHVETEALINDKLGEALKIVILAIGSGKWKFADDPPNIMRNTETPQYWA